MRAERLWPWLLAAIIALGAFLRLRTLGADDLWLDEVLTLRYTRVSVVDMWLQPSDPTPPVFFTLQKLFADRAETEVAIRALSAGAGIAAIPVVFAVGRSLAGPGAGLAAALFLAVSGPHIEYSQEARAYALAFLFTALSAAGMAGHLGRDHGLGSARTVHAVFGVVAVYTHLSAFFWLLASEAALLVVAASAIGWRDGFHRWSKTARWSLLGVLPAFGMTATASSEFDWLEQVSSGEVLAILASVGLVRDGLSWQVAGSVALAAALVPGVLRLRHHRPAALVVGALALMPVMAWMAGFYRPVFMFRTVLPFLLVPVLLWSLSVARLPRLAGVGLAAIVGAILLASYLAYERSERGGYAWSSAAAFLAENARAGDVALLCAWNNYPPLRHYTAEDAGLPYLGVTDSETAVLFPSAARDEDPWLDHWDPNAHPATSPAQVRQALRAGATLWVVDPNCAPHERESLDGFLRALGAEPVVAWEGQQMAISASRF